MKTSAPPVSVSVSGQTPTVPTSNDSVVVSIVTSQPKSVEERIYLRWSTDTFITSHMVEAVGSGVNYSAMIPAQPAGTSVQYCITTSTVDLSQVVTSGTIDFLTLSTSSNTHFVVAPGGTPTPTATPTTNTDCNRNHRDADSNTDCNVNADSNRNTDAYSDRHSDVRPSIERINLQWWNAVC